MNSLCVFCGSFTGDDPAYTAAARRLGALLAAREVRLVYGGGSVGLMAEVASAVLEAGGQVTGVIPRALLEREVGLVGLPDLRVVGSMHERKALRAEISDGFAALPGGIGTLEEFFEVWTWAQLGVHLKPCGLLNTAGYYDHLIGFMDQRVSRRFRRREHRDLVIVEREPDALLDRLQAHRPPEAYHWIDPRDT